MFAKIDFKATFLATLTLIVVAAVTYFLPLAGLLLFFVATVPGIILWHKSRMSFGIGALITVVLVVFFGSEGLLSYIIFVLLLSLIVGQLLKELGFNNALNKTKTDHLSKYLKGPYLQLNSEVLSDINPGRMFIMADKGENDPNLKSQEKDPVWQDLDAVKNNRVSVVDRNTWARARGIISSEQIAKELVEISKKQKEDKQQK